MLESWWSGEGLEFETTFGICGGHFANFPRSQSSLPRHKKNGAVLLVVAMEGQNAYSFVFLGLDPLQHQDWPGKGSCCYFDCSSLPSTCFCFLSFFFSVLWGKRPSSSFCYQCVTAKPFPLPHHASI